MRLGISAGVYYPEMGGSGTYLRRLRADLMAAGHAVQVVCFGEDSSEPGVVRVSRRSAIPLRLLKFTWAAFRFLRRTDVWFVNEYGFSATLLAPLYRGPRVMKVIGDWAWESGVNQGLVPPPGDPALGDPLLTFEPRRQHPRVEVRKAIRRVAAKRMDRVLVPSEYLARVVAGWGVPGERIVVIHNGIDVVERPAPIEGRQPGLIVTVARLTAWKGIDHLIRALVQVRRDVPQAQLLILGDGPERPGLTRLASELGISGSVTFAGQVDRTVVHEHLARARAFALPSAYEGLPHVALEALTEGCPAVAAAAGGTPEVIRDEVDGLLVPYGDADALARALTRLLTDRELAERFNTTGPQRVIDEFSWQGTSAQTVRFLAGLVR